MALAPTNAATISIAQTLALLDGPFQQMAEGVAEGRYVFWIGSGISLDRVDGLKQVIPRALEFLRSQIDLANPACRFRAAMQDALALANLTPAEQARVDLGTPFETWPDAATLTQRLMNNYARLLDVQVAGEADDFLLWNGVNIAATFANSGKEPDVEHLCLVLLVLEGAATDLATANWDGLIEKAADDLTGHQPTLVVCVRPEDLQEPAQRAWLYKFHGCAVLAVADEARYRPFLIGRASQINGWAARAEHRALVTRLVSVIASKPTVMIGLSAQDANIQAIFAEAEQQSPWTWPGARPSLVFSADQIGADQRGMLQNVYRAHLTPANRQQVIDGAVLRAYGKPLLIALTMHVLCAKLRKLIEIVPAALDAAGRSDVQAGILALRDRGAVAIGADRLAFVKAFVDQSCRALSLFRDGRDCVAPRCYTPLTLTPVHRIAADPNIPASGLRELAAVLGLLGIGVRDGFWSVTMADPTQPASGVFAVTSTLGSAKLIFAANSHSAMLLQHHGQIPDEDAILVHSATIVPPMARHPRAAPGRTGKLGLRQVSVADLLGEAANSNELVQNFRAAVAI